MESDVAEVSVKECPRSGAEFKEVLKLLRLAKSTVGFLPDSAVRERADRGTLLIAISDTHEVAGYALYDLPRQEVRLRQLVVAPSFRGRGVARKLVNEIVSRHRQSTRGIRLACRRDFSENAVWPHLDFIPRTEISGRSALGRPLTIWEQDFGHPNLFSYFVEIDDRSLAVLDVNLVIDLADNVANESQLLTDDPLFSSIRFGVTDETFIELDRHEDAARRKKHKGFASGFEGVGGAREAWNSIEKSLRAALGERAKPFDIDIRQVSRAAAGGGQWFVTRDDHFRTACGETVKAITDLSVVSPTTLLLELDALMRGDTYRPAELEGTDVQVRSLRSSEIDEASRKFLNQAAGERFKMFRKHLLGLLSATETTSAVVFSVPEELWALAVLRNEDHTLEVPVCRVRKGSFQPTIARHLLGWLRSEAVKCGCVVHLTDESFGASISQVLNAESFLPALRGNIAIPIAGYGSFRELRLKVKEKLERLPADAQPKLPKSFEVDESFESAAIPDDTNLFHPYVLTSCDLHNFVVPIKGYWAAELVDPSLLQGQLFPRSRALGLRREHIYYRSARAAGGLRSPARILWYVSGRSAGAQSLRAVSDLTEIVVGNALQLYRRFEHLGTYSRAQVEEIGSRGPVMAIRFARTRIFRHPVPLASYRAAAISHGKRGVAMAGPQPIRGDLFDELIALGEPA